MSLLTRSIENYKRPQEEVNTLMNLARDKFRRLITEADRFAEAGVRVKVVGNVALLPADLQELIREAERLTSANSKAVLNIAFSYTSRDEMTSAVRRLSRAVKQGHIKETDISPQLIERQVNYIHTVLSRYFMIVIKINFTIWVKFYIQVHPYPQAWLPSGKK